MQGNIKIKRRMEIARKISVAIFAITLLSSTVLLFCVFLGTAEHFGWNSIWFAIIGYIYFWVLFALFWILSIYNVIHKIFIKKWSELCLIAQVICIITWIILSNTR